MNYKYERSFQRYYNPEAVSQATIELYEKEKEKKYGTCKRGCYVSNAKRDLFKCYCCKEKYCLDCMCIASKCEDIVSTCNKCEK